MVAKLKLLVFGCFRDAWPPRLTTVINCRTLAAACQIFSFVNGSDVYFTPTPDRVIVEMLGIADVTAQDRVYDLGCGDGRILIEAARQRGARAVGVDIDAALLESGKRSAEAAGVQELVDFRQESFFETDLRDCSVLMLYLMDSLNVRLRPKILSEMSPGSRVVTYSFEMGDWECDEHIPIAANGVSMWIVPADVSGTWEITTGDEGFTVRLQQKYQVVSGQEIRSGLPCKGRLRGTRLDLHLPRREADPVSLSGEVAGGVIRLTDASGTAYVGCPLTAT